MARTAQPDRPGSSKPPVRITQQFRARHNMTYELDCEGVPLVINVFFPVSDSGVEEWRIEAQSKHTEPASFASASAASRALALQHVAQRWRETMPVSVSNLDWNGVAQAMTAVRAL